MNPYFNNYNAINEQTLLEDLIVEAIDIYGIDGYYLPRSSTNYDKIYGTDDSYQYNSAHLLTYYLDSMLSYGGDRDMMSKFGLEIRDQITISVTRRRFQNEVGFLNNSTRPKEGDLIYFPFHKKCFQIKYVNATEVFWQLGKLYIWRLTCELFEYSGEIFNTTIREIDSLQETFSLDIRNYSITDENGLHLTDENGNIIVIDSFATTDHVPIADNEELQTEAEDILDWTLTDPFNEYSKGKI